MIYKLNFNEGLVEFCHNHGRAFLEAAGPREALLATRGLFQHTRNERVKTRGPGQFLVTFKVALDYRLPLVRDVEKAMKLLRTMELYQDGRYVDRYAVATVFMETGSPEFLTDIIIKEEISSLRKSAVVAREVNNVVAFIDYDIAIYNYIELNSKPRFRSRVVRKVQDTPSRQPTGRLAKARRK